MKKSDDDAQVRYLEEWSRRKRVRDEKKANMKHRHKEARRRWWQKIAGRR